MRRFFISFLLVLIVICIAGSVFWGVVCTNDYHSLTNNPATDSIEYLMLGLTYAIGFLVFGAVGLVSAVILSRYAQIPAVRIIALIFGILFALEVLISLALAFS